MAKFAIVMLLATSFCLGDSTSASAGDGEVVVIHTGDFHGHLIPRANVRADDAKGRSVGGLARVHTKVKEIRSQFPQALLLHTGDTIQGSAEVLFTRGQAIVDVLNDFRIDAFAPGNWEFVYGTERFIELFVGKDGAKPLAPWNAIGANIFYDGEPYASKKGQRVLPPYLIKQVGDVKIGLLGLTTDRGPQVVGRAVTKGFRFLRNMSDELDAEVQRQVSELRDRHNVDLLILMSEMGLANNIRLSERISGIDVVLSSDMHEETRAPVVTKNGTVIIEEGQDGTMLGRLRLRVQARRVAEWDFQAIRVADDIPEDSATAAKINEIRKSFVSGPAFVSHVNPFNGSKLRRPIDTVVGETAKSLHRSNFTSDPLPGVIEGSSHNFLTDAFRNATGAQIGAIRGFRYGTHVPVGPIKMEDLYHFIPIGPQIAVGTIKGKQIKNQIENAAHGALAPDVSQWTGGWLFNFSGVTMDFDPSASVGTRASNIKVGDAPLDLDGDYRYASYWYANDPDLINVVSARNIQVLKDENGEPLDGTEVVVRYLQSLPARRVDPFLGRIRLVKPLPQPAFSNPEVQPLRGVGP